MGRGRPPKNAPAAQSTESLQVTPAAAIPSSQDAERDMNDKKNMTGDTVIVGCKLPCGLMITLGGKTVELAGARESNVIGGFGLTYGVDADFFQAWKKTYAELDVVKKELVFAYGDERSTRDMAKEREKERTGLEALNPDKPGPGLERVPETDDEE